MFFIFDLTEQLVKADFEKSSSEQNKHLGDKP